MRHTFAAYFPRGVTVSAAESEYLVTTIGMRAFMMSTNDWDIQTTWNLKVFFLLQTLFSSKY